MNIAEKQSLHDPVCGMLVNERSAAGHVSYEGTEYYFCCPRCQKQFEENPSYYLSRGSAFVSGTDNHGCGPGVLIVANQQMNDSGSDADGLTLPKRAEGYRQRDGVSVKARSESMSIPWAAGGMYSTTHDLLKWLRGLFQGKLLSAASLHAMTTPRKGAYGLGMGAGLKHGLRAIWHDGGIEGFNCYLPYLPDRKIAIIVLANQDGDSAEKLASELVDLVLTK